MRKTNLYNGVSESLVKKTMLKPGEQVVYRLYNMQKNPMNPEKIAIPSAKNVPPVDTIWDEEKGEYIDIACIKSVDAQGNHNFQEIFFYGNMAGHLILQGGRAFDQEIHTYLTLCDYNASKPNRDTTKEIIFERVDEEVKAEKESRTRNIRREALNAAADLTPEEVKDYAAALGKDDSKPVKVLRNELEEMADSQPEDFMSLINNKQAVMKATINRALKKNVLVFNEEQSRFEWPNKEAILTVARTTGSDAIEELISFCISSAKGEKVFQTIQSKAKK